MLLGKSVCDVQMLMQVLLAFFTVHLDVSPCN